MRVINLYTTHTVLVPVIGLIGDVMVPTFGSYNLKHRGFTIPFLKNLTKYRYRTGTVISIEVSRVQIPVLNLKTGRRKKTFILVFYLWYLVWING
jgi:hypothetical protein